jgi:uncharacterized protein with PIN domain
MQKQTTEHHSWGKSIQLANESHAEHRSYRCPEVACRIKAERERTARVDKLVGFEANPPPKDYMSDQIYAAVYECSNCGGIYWNHIGGREIKSMKADGQPTNPKIFGLVFFTSCIYSRLIASIFPAFLGKSSF